VENFDDDYYYYDYVDISSRDNLKASVIENLDYYEMK
jgi:hypothetical protein